MKALTSGVLKPRLISDETENASDIESQQAASKCATFKKQNLSFHSCCLLGAWENPTGKDLYLVCVTTVKPEIHQRQAELLKMTDNDEKGQA